MWLTIRSGAGTGTSVEVTGDSFLVGRDESCDLFVDDDRVSRQHLSLTAHADGRATVRDLGSMNGTAVDGHRLEAPLLLEGGEVIEIGSTTLVSSLREGSPHTTAAQPPAIPPTVVAGSLAPPIAAAVAREPEVVREPEEPPQTPSRIERIKLRRSMHRLTIVAAVLGVAVVAAIAIGALVATGVVGGNGGTATATASGELSIPELVAATKPSTVLVDTSFGGQELGSGTGWVYDAKRGLIVTNGHVVNDGDQWTVVVGSDKRPAKLVGVAPCDDLAVLQVTDRKGLVTLPLGSQATLEQGQEVVALGYPANAALGADLTATAGVVSVVRTRFLEKTVDVPEYPNVIQTDATINPGNSGGPLVNLRKKLVGVNSATITLLGGRTIQGQAYAIGVDRVRLVVPSLAEGKSQAWVGLGIVYPDEVNLSSLGLPTDTKGLIVLDSVPGSPAAEAGLGDVPALVTAIDGKAVDATLPSYCAAMAGKQPGDTVTFTAIKQGETTTTDIPVQVP